MIREIHLEHFKCFERLTLPLGALTLLSGVNASGKSTVIQALSLLHQSVVEAEWSGALLLDGSIQTLGTDADIVDKVYGRSTFQFGLKGSDFSARWRFGDPRTRATGNVAVPIHELEWTVNDHTTIFPGATTRPYRALLPASLDDAYAKAVRQSLARLDHIGAERVGPREIYRLGHEGWHDTVGIHGERAPGAIWLFGDETVATQLCLNDNPPTVRAQVQAWLNHFFPGVAYQVERVSNANAVTLGFRTNNETDFHRPQHVGYGITHVLPLIVAGLRANPPPSEETLPDESPPEKNTLGRRLLVVENPEVHLHPAGQAQIGMFLSRVAASGASVVLETHSDHVLNGVRRAVRQGILASDDVAIHFFRERTAAKLETIAQVVSPGIDKEGNIDYWPSGFFDQFDQDMTYFAGFGN